MKTPIDICETPERNARGLALSFGRRSTRIGGSAVRSLNRGAISHLDFGRGWPPMNTDRAMLRAMTLDEVR
jgi:hypothetical protein